VKEASPHHDQQRNVGVNVIRSGLVTEKNGPCGGAPYQKSEGCARIDLPHDAAKLEICEVFLAKSTAEAWIKIKPRNHDAFGSGEKKSVLIFYIPTYFMELQPF
jgi:hypothetical protein